jgi:integrase
VPWKKGNQWVGQVRQGERRMQKVFSSKADALEWEADQRRRPADQWKTRLGYSLKGLANEYLLFSKANHSQKSYEEKERIFRRFFFYVDPSLSYQALNSEMLLDYLQDQARKRSGHSANKDRKHLLSWANWINRDKGILNPSFALIRTFPEERKVKYIPSEEDFWRTYENAEKQDKTILLAYLHLAARRNELLRLRWNDIDFATRTVRLVTREREDRSWEESWLPMTNELNSALATHRSFVKGQLVFPNRQTKEASYYGVNFMQRLCKEAGIKSFSHVTIRHLAASIMARYGVPVKVIQAIVHHRDSPPIERNSYQLEDLRQALELLSKGKRFNHENPLGIDPKNMGLEGSDAKI